MIDEVAVEIDIAFGHPPRMCEAIGVHRMDQEEAAPLRPFANDGLAQEADLAARAQKPLHAVGRRGDDVEQIVICRPQPAHIGIERAAVRPGGVRIAMVGQHRAGIGAGVQKLAAGLGIVCRKVA